jgi:hypothetical protein
MKKKEKGKRERKKRRGKERKENKFPESLDIYCLRLAGFWPKLFFSAPPPTTFSFFVVRDSQNANISKNFLFRTSQSFF